jgi:hypothetical protein
MLGFSFCWPFLSGLRFCLFVEKEPGKVALPMLKMTHELEKCKFLGQSFFAKRRQGVADGEVRPIKKFYFFGVGILAVEVARGEMLIFESWLGMNRAGCEWLGLA